MFKSGRTIEQGMRASVPEQRGGEIVFFVTPQRFDNMRKAFIDHPWLSPDQQAFRALRDGGMLEIEVYEIIAFRTPVRVVVDYELND